MKLISLFWLVRGRGSSLARSALPPGRTKPVPALPPAPSLPAPRPGPPRPSAGWRGRAGAGRAAVTALVTSAGRGRGGGGAGEREPRGGAILASSAAGQPFTGLGCVARQQTSSHHTSPRLATPDHHELAELCRRSAHQHQSHQERSDRRPRRQHLGLVSRLPCKYRTKPPHAVPEYARKNKGITTLFCTLSLCGT